MVPLLRCKATEDQAGLSSHGYRVKPALLPTLCQYEQPAMYLNHCTQTFPGRSAATLAVLKSEKVCHDNSDNGLIIVPACTLACCGVCASCTTRKISPAGSLKPVRKCYDDQTQLSCLHMQCI